MLTEIKDVRQNSGEPHRRIFNSDEMSVTIWEENDSVCSFQIMYEEDSQHILLHWSPKSGLHQRVVDDGEETFGKHKKAPVLTEQSIPLSSATLSKALSAIRLESSPALSFVKSVLEQAL